MLFSSSNITHIRWFLFIEAVRCESHWNSCLYIADFDLRCQFPSEKMSPVLVLHHYPHIKLPVRYFLWFHEDPWPWASRPCLRGSVGDNYYVSCMQICSAPRWLQLSLCQNHCGWRPISTSRCSRSLTASEEVKVTVYTNTHVSRSAPTPMMLHAPTPWAGIGSLSLQLNQTLVDSDQSQQYILLDTLLAGIISYIIDFHQRTQRLTERGFRKCSFFQNPSCSFPLNFKVQTHKLQSLGLNMAIELSRGTSGQSPL